MSTYLRMLDNLARNGSCSVVTKSVPPENNIWINPPVGNSRRKADQRKYIRQICKACPVRQDCIKYVVYSYKTGRKLADVYHAGVKVIYYESVESFLERASKL